MMTSGTSLSGGSASISDGDVSTARTPNTSACFSTSRFHTASALSPMPFSVTSSRAIAIRMSSPSSIACRPSLANFPSIASETSSFFPISLKHASCMVPA